MKYLEESATYCFLRKDLPDVVRAIQLGHACLELGKQLDSSEPIANLVLFEVANEQELLRVEAWLKDVGVKHHNFYEPDYSIGYTAICCEPLSGDQRVPFSGFSLFKWERETEETAARRDLVSV